jgi:hypothetical protein
MKKLLFSIAVFAILLTMSSCNDDETAEKTNPFVGTWENEAGYRTVFTKTVVTGYYPNGDIYWTGTYTYNDTQIIINLDQTLSSESVINASTDGICIDAYSFEGEYLYYNYVRLTKIS